MRQAPLLDEVIDVVALVGMTSMTGLVAVKETSGESLIKTDVLGRIKRTREQRERILDEYERSGLSGPKFAALCGVKYQTFANWLQRRKQGRRAHAKQRPATKAAAKVQWLEARLPSVAPPAAVALLLQLPGGVRAEITSREQVSLAAALVRALGEPC